MRIGFYCLYSLFKRCITLNVPCYVSTLVCFWQDGRTEEKRWWQFEQCFHNRKITLQGEYTGNSRKNLIKCTFVCFLYVCFLFFCLFVCLFVCLYVCLFVCLWPIFIHGGAGQAWKVSSTLDIIRCRPNNVQGGHWKQLGQKLRQRERGTSPIRRQLSQMAFRVSAAEIRRDPWKTPPADSLTRSKKLTTSKTCPKI